MRPAAWLGVLIVVLAVAPLVLPAFFLQLLTEIAIVGLFATAFNLLMGFGGMVSFGHAAYFALGAYTAALLVKRVGLPLLLALCLLDRNEWGAVSRCWRGRYARRLARRFDVVGSAWNGLLIGPQGRVATGIADFLVDGPFPALLGRFAPKMFFHLRRRPAATA